MFPKGGGLIVNRLKTLIPRVVDEPRVSEAHLITKVLERHLVINVHKPERDSMIRVIKIHPILCPLEDVATSFPLLLEAIALTLVGLGVVLVKVGVSKCFLDWVDES
ncbi:hypothetical protein MTR_7g445290 [Medicago truncatula]|uniref:Uncharacterized protein n=1 Tax=Medicago truncatula TaxID=3880 RepID=A0A072TY17_MEDTR|nr:hypothetical protein MTR_7g445290 [Medicago truncatula]